MHDSHELLVSKVIDQRALSGRVHQLMEEALSVLAVEEEEEEGEGAGHPRLVIVVVVGG